MAEVNYWDGIVRTDFIDYPTAWAIQRHVELEHHPDCSSIEASIGGRGGAGFLCDCAAMPVEWARRAIQQEPERKADITEALQPYLPEHMRTQADA